MRRSKSQLQMTKKRIASSASMRIPEVRRLMRGFVLAMLSAAAFAQAAPEPFFQASGGPNNASAVICQTLPRNQGNTPVSHSSACSDGRGSLTTAAAANFGHVGASSQVFFRSNSSLAVQAWSDASFRDFAVFTSSDPRATAALISANLLLHGILDFHQSDPFQLASASLNGRVEVGQSGGVFHLVNVGGSSFEANLTSLSLVSGVIGPSTDAVLRTVAMLVPLNQLVEIDLGLETGTAATGFSAAAADFGGSFKFVTGSDAFNLPDGVTVNSGTWLVNNRFVDASVASVSEPPSWALTFVAIGLLAAMIRRH